MVTLCAILRHYWNKAGALELRVPPSECPCTCKLSIWVTRTPKHVYSMHVMTHVTTLKGGGGLTNAIVRIIDTNILLVCSDFFIIRLMKLRKLVRLLAFFKIR